ncbi:hypothetical protein BKA56DRAFT_610044 [Ilyonectria sp. MPI-CAGE-AT-0026]|nr:hypothetical protein BKA56DRAFT_610044 [Ilyonectria sp. MPI-CAGE-AT-0026]
MPHLLRRTPHGFSFVSLFLLLHCTSASTSSSIRPSHISHPTSASTVVPVPPAHSHPRSHAPTLRGSTAHGPRTVHQRVRSKAMAHGFSCRRSPASAQRATTYLIKLDAQ